MPKNAAQRLQKIENDIKTVISIYDVTNKAAKDDDRAKRDQGSSQPSRTAPATGTCSDDPAENNETDSEGKTFLNSLKKFGSFVRRPAQDFPRESPKKYGMFKPGSAPSSVNALPRISESHHTWQPLGDSRDCVKPRWETGGARAEDNAHQSECHDSSDNPGCEVYMTPSKTIETANDVLAKNNFQTQPGPKVACSPEECNEIEEAEGNDPTEREINAKRRETTTEKSPQRELHETLTTKSFSFPKAPHEDPKRDRSALEISTGGRGISNKIQKIEKLRPGSPELKNARPPVQETPDKDIKNWRCNVNVEGKDVSRRKAFFQFNSGPVEDGKNPKFRASDAFRGQREGSLEKAEKEPRPGEQRVSHFTKACTSSVNVQRTLEEEDCELGTHELFRVIERKNEKLEKMRISKELALDIAKQLKDKYEEIQQSKEEMLERLQNVERDNERLHNEVKNAFESKRRLQLKMEGFRMDSETVLLEQDARTKEILEENVWLKVRLNELEKRHLDELLENEKKLDRIKRDRFVEDKIDFKSRDDKREEIQRLVAEKSELLAKIDELRFFLNTRHSKEELLEEKIHQLQQEIQTQRRHLREKTDSLEETNKELEIIRLNSKELEDQVKMLRTNIEDFDKKHQILMKQSLDYELQIQSNQEEVKKLRDENAKLKVELENEKDALLIKNKIIEDQQETIKQMREKAEEAKTLNKRNQSLERVLNIEREEKLELQEAVQRLKWRKEELKTRVKTLEGDLLLAPQEVVRDLQKTQIVLHELENQVQIKQKEWELHLQSLIREKEQACSVAEFATKKLMQTTNEFQKQSEAQKRLHKVLAENLAVKEKHLREANEKAQKYKESMTRASSNNLRQPPRPRTRTPDKRAGSPTERFCRLDS